MKNGYYFYIDNMLLPITPPSLKMTIGSQNKTVTLINEGEINILKSPSLVDISFTARFPMREYPYSRQVKSFETYYEHFAKLKTDKKPFQFIVVRDGVNGVPSWDTNLTVALESFTLNEDHDYGDDVLIDFKLRQYKNFGVKTVLAKGGTAGTVRPSYTAGNQTSTRPTKQVEQSVVKTAANDNAYIIAKKNYGNGGLWTNIALANQELIDTKTIEQKIPKKSIYTPTDTKLVLPSGKTIKEATGSSGGTGGGFDINYMKDNA